MKRSSFASVLLAVCAAGLTACSDSDITAPSPVSGAPAATASLHFSENFNLNVPSASRLESTGATPDYVNGKVVFTGGAGRGYLRTLEAYHNVSFNAEVTVTVVSGAGGEGIAFIGLGVGTPSGLFYDEPASNPSIYTRIMPNDFFGPSINTTDATAGFVNELFPATGGEGGDGTHRVRITWDAALHTYSFAIHSNYVEGTPFTPTTVLGPRTVGDVFTDARIFIGGAGSVTFDNLRVVTRPAK